MFKGVLVCCAVARLFKMVARWFLTDPNQENPPRKCMASFAKTLFLDAEVF